MFGWLADVRGLGGQPGSRPAQTSWSRDGLGGGSVVTITTSVFILFIYTSYISFFLQTFQASQDRNYFYSEFIERGNDEWFQDKSEEYKHLPAFQMRERRESSRAPGSSPAVLAAATN